MNYDVIDYVERGRSRYTEQFKNSNNFDKMYQILAQSSQELQRTLLSLLSIVSIDDSSGYNLDVIGNIVGQSREITGVAATGYFGFEEDPTAKEFGSTRNNNGGLYFSLNDSAGGNIRLPDPFYRSFIKAKIIQNNTGATPEDIIASAKLLFNPRNPVELIENDDTSFSLYIGREWDDQQLTVFPGLSEIDIAERMLPRPAGVKINYINESALVASQIVHEWSRAANKLAQTADNTLYQNMKDD